MFSFNILFVTEIVWLNVRFILNVKHLDFNVGKIDFSLLFIKIKKIFSLGSSVTLSKAFTEFLLRFSILSIKINLSKLLKFHKRNKKLVTLTAVRPPARFGAIKLNGNKVKTFKEKNKMDEGWINGGFFVIEPEFLNLIKNDETFLEREPLEKASSRSQLMAFKHKGFWQCMDTLRDKTFLETLLKENKAPWI